MISVTKLNGTSITVNASLIETVEEIPDTVISLTTGRKIVVRESRDDIVKLVSDYNRNIFGRNPR
ncbi:MAG: flagellar FlbD family protein [Lachnospiraceae bacterium]|jgi:flagellar protein FlbD|nr:flagellar FlbD family protein [Lachnospiraceae bacterium]MEE3460447.1 flagellar FlbD family protein [Lachnospiraceae bacterium]